jgi:Type VI secretion system (T6SS), amidase immunity protein
METRRLKILGILIIEALLPNISFASNIREYKEKQLFLNYAYSACISSAFKSKEVKADANRSASGYIEFSHISFDAYQELNDSIKIWLAKKYSSKSGKSLQLMKCNDFYNSGDIQKIYNKYDPCKSKSSWLDKSEFTVRCE